MAKINIVTSGHFSTSPRVWKEADALTEAGYEVSVIGVWYEDRQAQMDEQMLQTRPWKVVKAADIRPTSMRSKALRNWYRFRRRAGLAATGIGFYDPHAFGYAVDRLLAAVRREKADLSIMHLEPALWVGRQLAAEGRRIGVDIEDWHSENEPGTSPNNHRLRFLRTLEQSVLKTAVHATTTSHALSRALAEAYRVRPPHVIYNSNRAAPLAPFTPSDELRLFWFSQTLGPGRGLEDLFQALGKIEDRWNLSLLCNVPPGMATWVREQVPNWVFERIRFLSYVSPERLRDVVSRHDIGFALETGSCRNKDLTASNKIFEYLQAGLTVVATETAGQQEVLREIPDAGRTYRSGDVASLVSQLKHLMADRRQIANNRRSIHQMANERFAYQQSAIVIQNRVEHALQSAPVYVC